MSDPEPHPLANLFPLLADRDLGELADDICTFGLRNPIVLYEGKVLDGRNRLAACRVADIEPEFIEYEGDEPLWFVLSHNLHRRHLSESQRAMVAARIVDWERGLNQNSAGSANLPTRKAAEKLSISERAVTAARRIHERGVPALVEAINNGRISVHAGEALSDLECAAQLEVLERERSEIIKQANSIRADRQQAKKARRAEREAELADRQIALPDRKFGVIYADPEWRFEPRSRETGMDRSADNHYPTSELEDIKARDVASIAADDCVLFLWATMPMLPQAIEVLAAWGFAYKSHCIWRKAELAGAEPMNAAKRDRGGYSGSLQLGTGYWFRCGHELLLVGTRGKVVAPAQGDQFPSVIDAPAKRHSEKPERFAELIEAYFPNLPKIELNRRGKPREGWSAWGNEVAG